MTLGMRHYTKPAAMHAVRRLAAATALVATAATAAAQGPPEPVFREDFSYRPGTLDGLLERWMISRRLDRMAWPQRVAVVADPSGRTVLRVVVEEGDSQDGATEALLRQRRLVCDGTGSRAPQMEAEPGGVAPTERAEIEMRADRATGAGEVIRFGEPVWYRFAFKLSDDWPRDLPANGRIPCRTVIHQIKQNAARDGVDCAASPFFKIEARPLGEGALFFAQVYAGDACADPPRVRRVQLCVRDGLRRGVWATVNVRLHVDSADGRADLWLDGAHCGTYRGPMGDGANGRRRDGVPFVDQQPRFGVYRDWRAEPQTIYFDRIMFWNADPTGHPDWRVGAPPP